MQNPMQHMNQPMHQYGDPQMMNQGGMMQQNTPQNMQMNPNFLHPSMVQNQMAPVAPQMPPPGTVALNTLIEYAVNKTFHDITVMAELLPSKTDMERKIAIVQFATRTRQLFIRLLGLVKWASSVDKVVKCSEISSFLDRQAMVFVDTADKIHILANQLVVQARLPNFSVPAAVDVLTTGTYPRLPVCIRDRIIPPDPILPKEKKAALKRIEQIILFRLVTEVIPPQIIFLKVEKGVVHLHVPGEFKALITLMGDGADIPWRLLQLEFLVEDREVGNGKSLVHSVQVNYIHELVQSRLFANDKPLVDLFNLLHSFCLSLKLEVLQAQADRLTKLRWGKFIQVEEYLPGQKLSLSYWRLNPHKKQTKPFSIVIRQTPSKLSNPLQIKHIPKLPLDDVDLVESASHINHLSLERLLNQSICIRSYHILLQVKEMLQKHIRHDPSYFSEDENGQSSVLFVPLLKPYKDDDCLKIFIDPQTGGYVPSIKSIKDTMLDKMEKEINDNQLSLVAWVKTLRDIICRERCRKSLQHLSVQCLDRLALANRSEHPVGELGDNLMYIKISRYPMFYVIVRLETVADRPTVIRYKYFLLRTSSKPLVEPQVKKEKAETTSETFALTLVTLNQALTTFNIDQPPLKRYKGEPDTCSSDDANQESELLHITAVCSARIPFILLMEKLSDLGIDHQGAQEEGPELGISCKIIALPPVKGISSDANLLLQDSVLQCSFRLHERLNKIWSVELIMKAPPLQPRLPRQQGASMQVNLHYDVSAHLMSLNGSGTDPVDAFLEDWKAIGRLYGPYHLFTQQLTHPACDLASLTQLYAFNYKTITIKYGSALSSFVSISWSENKFQLHFGRSEGAATSNAHCLVRHYLNEMFNIASDIAKLLHILLDTLRPLQALARLPTSPLIGVSGKILVADQVFSVIPQTPTHVRVTFMSLYCLDVRMRSDGMVAIRDGSFSQFDYSKIKNLLIPIPGLATFLAQFRDQKDVRHRSDAEKDNPPSPETSKAMPQASGANDYGLHDIPHVHWAGARFTLLSHEAVEIMCKPMNNPVRRIQSQSFTPCPLEQFLGATYVRRSMENCIRTTRNVTAISVANLDGADGSLASAFVSGSLQFICRPQPQNLRQLVLRIQPVQVGPTMENWGADDLHVLEKYFEMRVACSPYRFNAMKSFFTMISSPAMILRDFIQLMRYELAGARVGATMKWTINLCLTSPPRVSIAPFGMPSVLFKDKVLLFVQLTQNLPPGTQGNPQTVVIPLLHEPNNPSVKILAQAMMGNSASHEMLKIVEEQLSRAGETASNWFSHAVRFLMENLQL